MLNAGRCGVCQVLPANAPSTSTRANLVTPTLSKDMFSVEFCYASLKRDAEVRHKHPIEVCRALESVLSTPLSPPLSEQGPSADVMTPMPSTTGQ